MSANDRQQPKETSDMTSMDDRIVTLAQKIRADSDQLAAMVRRHEGDGNGLRIVAVTDALSSARILRRTFTPYDEAG